MKKKFYKYSAYAVIGTALISVLFSLFYFIAAESIDAGSSFLIFLYYMKVLFDMTATFVGYTSVINSGGTIPLAVLGSLVASFAVMLPSFILMLIISRWLMKYSRHKRVEELFGVLRPAVVGLIASAALLLMNSENFGSIADTPLQFWVSAALFLFAFVALRVFKLGPILILVICGAIGGVVYGVMC